MCSAFDQTRTLTKCTLQDRFLFSHFTGNLQFEEKKEYVEILSNVGLHVERSIWIILRLHFWSLVTDCGFVLRTTFAQQYCKFSVTVLVEIYYTN